MNSNLTREGEEDEVFYPSAVSVDHNENSEVKVEENVDNHDGVL